MGIAEHVSEKTTFKWDLAPRAYPEFDQTFLGKKGFFKYMEELHGTIFCPTNSAISLVEEWYVLELVVCFGTV